MEPKKLIIASAAITAKAIPIKAAVSLFHLPKNSVVPKRIEKIPQRM